jgi:hypothetical protein
VNQQQLVEAINAAAANGDQKAVQELTSALRALPMRPSDMTPQEAMAELGELPPRASEGMSGGERFLAGMGRAPVAVGQGVTQIAKHVTGAEDADEYDEYVEGEARRYEEDLGKTGAAQAGKLAGDLGITMSPANAVSRAVQAATRLGQGTKGMVAGNVGAGMVEGAVQPVTGGDFAQEKGQQIAVGGGFGGGAVVALEGLRRGIPAIVNSPGTAYNTLTQRAEGRGAGVGRDADRLGINLPAGARTGSKPAIMAENLARQSIFSMDRAFQADQRIAQQAMRSIDGLMNSIALGATDRTTLGRQVQETTNRAINRFVNQRNTLSQPFWREVDRAGMKFLPLPNVQQRLMGVMDEYQGVIGSEARGISSGVSDLLGALGENGEMSVRALVRNRRELARVAAGKSRLLGDQVSPATQRRVAAQLLEAIDQDLESASDLIGGEVGAALKGANMVWRQYSQAIEAIEKGPLGRLLGEDVAQTIGTPEFNTIDPDDVLNRLFRLPPESMRMAVNTLRDVDPSVVDGLRRQYIQDAMDQGMSVPPSAGQNVVPFIPSKFLSKLGYTPQDLRKQQALFEPGHIKDIQAVQRVLRAWGDQTGRNFSGTGPANEALQVFNSIANMSKSAVMTTFGQAVGTRRIAAAMADPTGARYVKDLLEVPEKVRVGKMELDLPALEQKAAYVVALLGVQSQDQAANQIGRQEEQRNEAYGQ